jgi:hypothetical protein
MILAKNLSQKSAFVYYVCNMIDWHQRRESKFDALFEIWYTTISVHKIVSFVV